MQKWQIELNATPLWLLNTFLGVTLALVLAVFLLAKTRFGKQFWQVTRPCLNRRNGSKILLVIALLLLLLLTEIRLNVLNTFFYNGLYSALQDANANAFWFFALINAGVVILRTLNGIINDFLDQALAIRWSQKFNQVLTEQWLTNKNYYRLQMRRHRLDNVDQRIQQDAQEFISSTIEFVRGMVNSVVSSIEFTLVLWGLSGILSLFGYHIPRGIVFFVFIFVLLATFTAMWIGRPLIKYNFQNEKLNGDYRYSLIRVRDHAESIAFYDGEQREHRQLSQRFTDIIKNRWRIAFQSVGLNGFNDLLTQGVQLLPLMLQAPRFFAGQIKIGDMHQTVQAFNRLQRALSFFRLFYERFTIYRARLERLSGFLSITRINTAPARPDFSEQAGALVLNNVTLYRKDGKALLDNINLQANRGDSLLLQGPSGCGKTSLLRALAGLWPFGSSGHIQSPPKQDIMFVPQRSYMPQGSLREAICYPTIDPQHPGLAQALADCRLTTLIPRLDQTDDWQQRLSPGELQRIAFARILLTRPTLILLDEATSALDEQNEAALYRLIRQRLPESIIFSIGHRSTLLPFHNLHLQVGPADCD